MVNSASGIITILTMILSYVKMVISINCDLRQYRTKIVVRTRSQLFCQIAQNDAGMPAYFKDFGQSDGKDASVCATERVARSLRGVALNKPTKTGKTALHIYGAEQSCLTRRRKICNAAFKLHITILISPACNMRNQNHTRSTVLNHAALNYAAV